MTWHTHLALATLLYLCVLIAVQVIEREVLNARALSTAKSLHRYANDLIEEVESSLAEFLVYLTSSKQEL